MTWFDKNNHLWSADMRQADKEFKDNFDARIVRQEIRKMDKAFEKLKSKKA